MFVSRVSERELLEKTFQSGRAELFVLYGGRRVGKTEWLAHFYQEKRHIFFVADPVPEQTMLDLTKKRMDVILFDWNEMLNE